MRRVGTVERAAATLADFATTHEFGYERDLVGCTALTGGWPSGSRGCAHSMRSGRMGDFFRLLAHALPRGAQDERFVQAKADAYCDCTHVGTNPHRLAIMAQGLLDAKTAGWERAEQARASP